MPCLSVLNGLRKYLPIQFPLGVFIHNNMLMAFEDMPFSEGVKKASHLYGARRAMKEEYYWRRFSQGRINHKHLRDVIQAHIKNSSAPDMVAGVSSVEILLDYLLSKMDSASWPQVGPSPRTWEIINSMGEWELGSIPGRWRKAWKDDLRSRHGERVNDLFHPIMIRFLSSYLDQGMAVWPNPDRQNGLLQGLFHYLESNLALLPEWAKDAQRDMASLLNCTEEERLAKSLEAFGSPEGAQDYLLLTLLELRGWAGMVNKFEKEPHLVPRVLPKTSLCDYVVGLLCLEHAVYRAMIAQYGVPEHGLLIRKDHVRKLDSQRILHMVAPLLGKHPALAVLEDVKQWKVLAQMLVNFDEDERCHTWQESFDLTTRDYCLGTLVGRSKAIKHSETEAYYLFCIDDREESIRRHLEEINPHVETFGVVGFFGVDMNFKRADHPEAIPQCPPVVTPTKTLVEEYIDKNRQAKNEGFMRTWGEGLMQLYRGTRGSLSSLFFVFVTGPLATLALLARVFFPGLRARKKEINTVIDLTPRIDPRTGIRYGMNTEERAAIVSTILKMGGVVGPFPKFVFIIAHGSTSSNNPFRNAYGCGACSGRAGIPNSRVFCKLANDPEVRSILSKDYKINIPNETKFISCYHDTTSDDILVYNEYVVPDASKAKYKALLSDLRKASGRNSLERCRWFAGTDNVVEEKDARAHVIARSQGLGEPRPEYGHTNNCMCVIGRRELTRGLFLDRRCFLTSYDATIDPDGKILAGVMAGAVPVAGGINLDYYFSRIDNEKYGSGTKLPLNVTSLLGVMAGGTSDLRIGLARQMVEMHSPTRISIVIEAEESIIKKIIDNHARMKNMAYNGWLHLVACHPHTGKFSIFSEGEFKKFEPGVVTLVNINSSKNYVFQKRGPLPFAAIS